MAIRVAKPKPPLLSPTGKPHGDMAKHGYDPVTQLQGVPVLRIDTRGRIPLGRCDRECCKEVTNG